MGIGIGLVFVPTVTIVSRYFTRMRGLAIGISMSGGPFGGMILTGSTFPFRSLTTIRIYQTLPSFTVDPKVKSCGCPF
jgi:MFS family permease